MRILSEERYSEIKKIINQAGNSTQKQLADQAKTSPSTIERVWVSVDYEDYKKGLAGEKMAIEDLDNLKVTKLTVEVAPTKSEVKEKRSLIEKIKYIFKR
jgi:hypothetical protein